MNVLADSDSKLCDLIFDEPSVMTVLYRFGISLGVSDSTIVRVCEERNLDRDFFITIINTYLYDDYFPERVLSSFSASEVISYLRQTNAYYRQVQIPNIERHFRLLVSKSDPSNGNLGLMLNFFMEVKAALLSRIDDDNLRWFPEVLALERQAAPSETAIVQFDEGADTIEDRLNDLINMFVMHLRGDYEHNLAQAVLLSLTSLRKDVAQNDRIRNRILRPVADALSKHLRP